jgi:hypothetical protein
MHAARILIFSVAAVAVFCSPAGMLANVPTPQAMAQGADSGTRGYGTVAIRIKVPRAAANGMPSLQRFRPQYISVSTKSFVLLTDGKDPVESDVVAVANYANFFLSVFAGTHTFTVIAYDHQKGTSCRRAPRRRCPCRRKAPCVYSSRLTGSLPASRWHLTE